MAQSRARLTVVSLGGTIASTPTVEGAGAVPTLTADDLIAAVPALGDIADVVGVSLRNVPSVELVLADVVDLHTEITRHIEAGSVGVVVTQGTDTLEEVAFCLDLLYTGAAPVVITGAMRPAREVSADGAANILAAARVASSEQARGLGCLVVLNDEIHAARLVRKVHATNLAAFKSPNAGAIGWVTEDRVRFMLRPFERPVIELATPLQPHAVALLKLGLGETPAIIECLPDLGFQGAVIEAFGGGHVPAQFVEPLRKLAAQLPVVFTSRAGAGAVLTQTYAFAGSEQDLARIGLLSSGRLDAIKARMLLALLLAAGKSNAAIAAAFSVIADS